MARTRGHNLDATPYFTLGAVGEQGYTVRLACSCGQTLLEQPSIDLQEGLTAVAEHNQDYIPTSGI